MQTRVLTGPGSAETFPDRLPPMHAAVGDAPFVDEDWLSEPKLDGYRMLAFVSGGEVRLVSRRGQDYSHAFPAIVAHLKKLKKACVLDGEMIAFDTSGKP